MGERLDVGERQAVCERKTLCYVGILRSKRSTGVWRGVGVPGCRKRGPMLAECMIIRIMLNLALAKTMA